MHVLLYGSLLLFTSLFALAIPNERRLVRNRRDTFSTRRDTVSKSIWLHVMLGNTYNYSLDMWTAELKLIKDAGVDVVVLNIGIYGDWQSQEQLPNAYNAASKTGLQVVISFDYSSFPCDGGQATVSTLAQYRNHPAQYRVNGKPVVSSFSGTCIPTSTWKSIQQSGWALNLALFGIQPSDLASGGTWGFVDYFINWGSAWPQGNYLSSDPQNPGSQTEQAFIKGLGANKYCPTVSANFYIHLYNNDGQNRILRSDGWLPVTRWEQLLKRRSTDCPFPEIISWNDYGESHYLNSGPPKPNNAPAGTNYANFNHGAFLDLMSYFISWYKTGTAPKVTQDETRNKLDPV